MSSVIRFQSWMTLAAVVGCVFLVVMERSSAQVGRADAIRSVQNAVPATVEKQGPDGESGSFVMDGDWFYILRGRKFYKVQKSTMSVFQTLDLN